MARPVNSSLRSGSRIALKTRLFFLPALGTGIGQHIPHANALPAKTCRAESQRAVCLNLSSGDDFDVKRSGFLGEHSLKLGDVLDVVSPGPNLHPESAEALP